MQKPEIYFHVGMPRTASTYLQRKFFPYLEGIRFIKKHDFNDHETLITESDQNKFLLSTEMDIIRGKQYDKLLEIARKYPWTRTILVLRRHDSWIASKYKYAQRKNSPLTFREFFNLEDTGFMHVKDLYYMDKIRIIEELFEHKPLVIFQEDLKSNPGKTLRRLARYMGVEFDAGQIKLERANRSFNNKSLYYLHKFNRWANLDTVYLPWKPLRKLFIKFSGLVTRIIVLLSTLFARPLRESQVLIPKEDLKRIRKFYSEDWEESLAYAKRNHSH